MKPLNLTRATSKWRSQLRNLLWWVWPSLPTSWAQVPARLRPGSVQIARLTVAAVISYIIADALSPGLLDLTAPLTALLVVQASTVGTLQMGLVRVGAVLTGVLVAVGVASFIGLSWWSLAIVIATSLALAKVLRLGEQSLEAPISSMLILAVSSPDLAAEVRVVNTLIGTIVGVAFSLLVPVTIPDARAREEVRGVARSQAGLLDEVALTIASRTPHPDEAAAWLAWADTIDADLQTAATSVNAIAQSRKLNPLALARATVHPGLADALSRLHGALAGQKALLSTLALQAGASDTDTDAQVAAELRRAFAVVLVDLASGLRSFAQLIDAEFGSGNEHRVDEALHDTVESVREARAVVTELLLIDVDPRVETDLWMLHGSVLAAVEHMLRQLDLEHAERRREAWLSLRGAPMIPRAWQSARRARGA